MQYNKEKLLKYDFFKSNEANFDFLTNVLDRKTIINFIEHQIIQNKPFSIAICDIDNFKLINDTLGHLNGDDAINLYVNTIFNTLGENGLIGRYGGDEFIIYLDDITEYQELWKVLKQLSNNVRLIKGENDLKNVIFTQTVGASRYPLDGESFDDLFKTADRALYRGKQKGRNCFIIYKPELHKNIDISLSSPFVICKQVLQKANNIFDLNIDKQKKIKMIFDLLIREYQVDHICINFMGELIHEGKKEGNNYRYFHLIDDEFEKLVKKDYYCTHDFSLIREKSAYLHQRLFDQHVKAICVFRLSYRDNFYGYLRIEDSTVKRVWQDSEIASYIAISKLIAIMLHEG